MPEVTNNSGDQFGKFGQIRAPNWGGGGCQQFCLFAVRDWARTTARRRRRAVHQDPQGGEPARRGPLDGRCGGPPCTASPSDSARPVTTGVRVTARYDGKMLSLYGRVGSVQVKKGGGGGLPYPPGEHVQLSRMKRARTQTRWPRCLLCRAELWSYGCYRGGSATFTLSLSLKPSSCSVADVLMFPIINPFPISG